MCVCVCVFFFPLIMNEPTANKEDVLLCTLFFEIILLIDEKRTRLITKLHLWNGA